MVLNCVSTRSLPLPDLEFENAHKGLVAGVDEAGRGPWAGPVVAAAVILDTKNIPEGINDSKKLSAKRREALYDPIFANAHVAVGLASVAEIDDLNILGATMLAMRRALRGLFDCDKAGPDYALIDGNQLPLELPCPAETLVKGDARSLSIAAASIIAKVSRDRLMADLDSHFPGYGWKKNQGYGTAQHSEALQHLGVTIHHRTSFAPIQKLIKIS
jgi:ribonuclease HII